MNDILLEAAKEAIDTMFNDTSVTKEDTIENLNDLKSDIDIMLEAIKYD